MTLKVFQKNYSVESDWKNAGEKTLQKVSYHILFMVNERELLWVPNFTALRIYFVFGTKFSWNEGIDTCFNVECVLLCCNFGFLGGYCSLPSGYCSLPVVTARYRLLLLIPTYSINGLVERFLSLKPGLLKEKFSIAPWFLLPFLGEVTGSFPASRQSFLEILSSRKVEQQIFRYLTKIPNLQ